MSNSNRMFDIRALGGFKSNDMGFEDFVKNVAKSGVSVGNAYMGKVSFAGGLPEAYTEGTMTVMILTDGLVKYIFNAPSVPYVQYECYSKDGGEPTVWSVGSGGGVADLMVEITYGELKSLRDSGGLVPGMKYRITDYETMTAVRSGKIEGSYHSAGHRFDVIVTADTESSLNENATAIRHDYGYEDVSYVVSVCIQGYNGVDIWQRWPSEDYVDKESGDTHYAWNWVGDASDLESVDLDSCSWNVDDDYYAYSTVDDLSVGSIFSDEEEEEHLYEAAEIGTRNVPVRDYFDESNLSAWKLKYCLDNDGERFDWARVFVHGDFIYTFNTREGIKNRGSRTCEYMRRCTVGEIANSYGILIEYRETSSIQADTIVDFYYTYNPIDNTMDCRIILDPMFGESLGVYTVKNISDNKYIITTLGSCLENKGFVLGSEEFEPNVDEGRGVIYELTDEFNNTVLYDFKNLMFGIDRFYYTFDTYDEDGDINIDFSLKGYVRNCRSISVGSYHSIYNVAFIYSDYDNEWNYVNDCTFYPLISANNGNFAFYELAKYYEDGIYGWTFKHNNITPNIIKHEVYRQAFSENVEMQDLKRIEFFKSGQIPIDANAFSITLPNEGYRDSNKTVYIDASIEFSAGESFTLELPSGSRFIGNLKCAEGKTYLVTFSEGVFYIGEIKVL